MKIYIKYIFLSLISCIGLISCVKELELAPTMPEHSDLTLVPRVKNFTNQYVTKAEGNNETDIKTLNVLIFNEAGNLVYSKSHTGELSSVTLNKSMLNLTNATIVMIANIDFATILNGTKKLSDEVSNKPVTLSDMEDYVCHFSNALLTAVPDSGLPMIGGTKVTAEQANSNNPLAISLKILYSKVNFEISVENGGENYGTCMEFTLSGATITNFAGATPFAVPTEEGKPVCDFLGNPVLTETGEETNAETNGYTDSGYIVKNTDGDAQSLTITGASGNTKVGATTPLSFTFYIPENRYNHGGLTGIYPDASWTNSTTSSLYDSYKQHYKPALAAKSGGAGMPSYVTLTGTYVDYRGTSWDVNYTVYLGKDNYQNFQVDRNSQYTNYITIKGIRNNDTYTDAGSVWMDHRVDASLSDNQGADDCITITRETLIDSHIEVRPLRIKYGSNYSFAVIYLPKYPLDRNGNIIYDTTEPQSWGQVLEREGGENENWIAIENNNGKYNKGKLYCANGKRKYFTTSLIEELHLDNDAEQNGIRSDDNGRRYILLNSEDCAWIYFDENNTTNTRRALIDVEFYRSDGSKVVETYEILQSGLKEAGKYKIERYEEYLHSYDSEDEFGLATSPTDYTQQGLSWGFFNQAISQDIIVSATPLSGINLGGSDIIDFRPLLEQRYDYFHESDVPNPPYYLYTKDDKDAWTNASYGTGLTFTDRASRNEFITVKDMGTRPTSAYQYCLSKNKFQEDPNGEEHQMIIHWYLPDAYELQDVLNVGSSNSESDIFKTDAYYWSSQPSFDGISINLGTELSIKNEVPANARAVSKDGIVDIERNRQNRIRCFYDPTGILADMNERVPEGLGGLIKVPMRAFDEDNSRGYFYDWLQDLEDESDTPKLEDHKFPMGKDFYTFDTYVYNGVTYYAVNPSDRNNWSSSLILTSNTLYHYPGLSSKVVILAVEQDTDKEYQRTETDKEGKKIEEIPSNDDLAKHPLDLYQEENKNYGILTIAFDKGSNNSNSPSYSYRREDEVTIATYTRLWEVPKYDEVKIEETSGSEKKRVQVSYSIYNERDGLLGALTYDVGKEYIHEGITYIITKRYTEGSILNRKYYFDLGPITINKTVYTYKEGTGGWGQEKKSTSEGAKQSTIDKLELFGGNQFTISAIDGYRIRSIRVNYSGSNNVERAVSGENNNRFLRLVDARIGLPLSQNISPDNMSYSPDGERGWFKWTASSDDDLVSDLTLTLATYTVTESYSIFGYQVPSSFRYIKSTNENWYESDFNTSIVIDSIEIRVEEE